MTIGVTTSFTCGKTDFFLVGYDAKLTAKIRSDATRLESSRGRLTTVTVKEAVISPMEQLPGGALGCFAGGAFTAEGAAIPEAQTTRLKEGIVVGSRCIESDVVSLPYLPYEVAIYGGPVFSGYGHIILETLARISGIVTATDLPIVFVGTRKAQQKSENIISSFLSLFDIDKERVVFCHEPRRCRELIVPSPGISLGLNSSSVHFDILSRLSNRREVATPPGCGDFVYLSRRQLGVGHRKAHGEDAVERFFEKQGYSSVFPEMLSIENQIGIASNSKSISGFIGSQLHNIIFRNVNSPVDIFYMTDAKPNRNFLQIDLMFGGRRVYCNVADYSPFFNFGNRAPFHVDFLCLREAGKIFDVMIPTTFSGHGTGPTAQFSNEWIYNFLYFKSFRKASASLKMSDEITAQIIMRDHLIQILNCKVKFEEMIGGDLVSCVADIFGEIARLYQLSGAPWLIKAFREAIDAAL